jgi:hypothetical protein
MPKLDWMLLANYAEAPPGGGLIYIMGGGVDTVTLQAPLEGAPPDIQAAMNAYLCIRVLFHITETNREHSLEVDIIDEDGKSVGKVQGTMRVDRAIGLPASWDQGTNVVLPLIGLGLPKFGVYMINVSVNGAHLGDRPFRVLKGY